MIEIERNGQIKNLLSKEEALETIDANYDELTLDLVGDIRNTIFSYDDNGKDLVVYFDLEDFKTELLILDKGQAIEHDFCKLEIFRLDLDYQKLELEKNPVELQMLEHLSLYNEDTDQFIDLDEEGKEEELKEDREYYIENNIFVHTYRKSDLQSIENALLDFYKDRDIYNAHENLNELYYKFYDHIEENIKDNISVYEEAEAFYNQLTIKYLNHLRDNTYIIAEEMIDYCKTPAAISLEVDLTNLEYVFSSNHETSSDRIHNDMKHIFTIEEHEKNDLLSEDRSKDCQVEAVAGAIDRKLVEVIKEFQQKKERINELER